MLFDRAYLSRCLPLFGAAALLGLAGLPAHAQNVVTSTGGITFLTAPINAAEGANASDTNVLAFMENQNLVLTSNVAVNISSPGTYNSSPLSPATIFSGSDINSYYIYSDPSSNGSHTYTGTITFDANIIGIITNTANLNASDTQLGTASGYPSTDSSRGLELNGNANTDTIALSSDLRTISWTFKTNNNSVDSIRILTAVPEPTAALPIGLMLLGGLALWRRRPSQSP